MKDISAKTKLAGILGNPVGHSLSPALHGYLAEQTGVDLVYLAFCAERENLKAIFDGSRAMGVLGFNVTSPFKIDAVSLMDELDPEAEKIGNINTVVNQNGKWIGYNTDGEGFIRSLHRNGISPLDKHVLLLGAGGTARTLSYKLAQNGAKSVTIFSRRRDALADIRPAVADFPATALYEDVNPAIRYELVVNCTPLGMAPRADQNPMPQDVQYHDAMVCCDLIYNPAKTLFLRAAEQAGARILNGMDMFIYQGILAYEHFTGIRPDETVISGLFKKWSFTNDRTESD